MRRRALLFAVTALPLAGCGDKPPPPTVLGLIAKATPDANRDATGAAKPLRARVLLLTTTQTFLQSDFFALDADPMKALGREFTAVEELILAPGAEVPIEIEVPPSARFVGVMGAYQAIDRTEWRAVRPLQKGVANLLTATYGPAGVQLQERSA